VRSAGEQVFFQLIPSKIDTLRRKLKWKEKGAEKRPGFLTSHFFSSFFFIAEALSGKNVYNFAQCIPRFR
jgi:hypothetical protein